MVAALAVILLHTFVPHHHHDTHECEQVLGAATACHDVDCPGHDAGDAPVDQCKLQQLLAQLTLSSRDERLLALTLEGHLDLAPWMEPVAQPLLPEEGVAWQERTVAPAESGVPLGLALRGPPMA